MTIEIGGYMACSNNCSSDDVEKVQETIPQNSEVYQTPSQILDEKFITQPMSREEEELINLFQNNDTNQDQSKAEFQEIMRDLSNPEKGTWGERATIGEAKSLGHEILIEHADDPTSRGFDCVSYNAKTGELHIWEAKNFSGGRVYERTVGAWNAETDKQHTSPRQENQNSYEPPKYEFNMMEILNSVRGDPEKLSTIKQAFNEGKVSFHVRLGPETKIGNIYAEQIENQVIPGAKYDWLRYSYEYALQFKPDKGESLNRGKR